MAVTRIKNNQITDSTVNAAAKLVDFSITAGKLANNITYGSDWTITGNLTVNGQTTTIDTVSTVIEDPVIVLASNQSGAPAVDIGFIGERGTSNNIAFVWDESTSEFVTVYTTDTITNTVVTISSYANFHTNDANIGGNIVINGTTSLVGNIVGSANATGNVTSGNLLTPGLISATGNVTGGNITTGGQVSATGNITANYYFGNGSQLTGLIADSATALVNGNTNITTAANGNANVTIGGTSNVVVWANTGQYVTGLVSVSGNIDGGNLATGGNITGGNVLTGGLISATSTITGGNLATGGTASAGGNITGANILTGGLVSATANITGGNVLTGGLISATGNITGGNINTAGQLTGGNIVISGDNITDTNGRINFNTALGDVDTTINGTAANVFYVDAGTNTASFGNARQITNALVSFNSSNSILFPVGNTNQRPSVGVTGMLRFNTSTNAVEVYDNSTWTGVGQTVFTVIADEQFNGDGATTVFTLSSSQTTSSCIVSINGVVQIPTLAYSVSGTTLTFTEAPASGDVIDVRELTTTTTITSISNSPANAVISVQDTSDVVQVTGQLSVTGGIIGLNSSSISNGTSNLAVIASNGNIRANVNGATIATFWSGGINNGQGNGVGNIGTASSYFNTVFAQATSAQYADLAEMYAADASYAPGTVLSFGGANEVTQSNIDSDRRVAGVVSTNPSYIMNAGQVGDNVVAVALTGRVPTSVTGSVTKGDLMVSNGDGTARAEADPRVGTVIGKALADSEGNTVIEVVVGRF